jgi:hypothetical protein
MVDIIEISAIVAAAGVLIGVIYYILDIHYQTSARKTDLLMKVYSIWGSSRFSHAFRIFLATEIVDWDSFVQKHGSNVSAEPAKIWDQMDLIGTFFNEIGFLVREGLISKESVHDFLGYWVIIIWEKMKPLVYGWRKAQNIPESYRWFEYLYNEMPKSEQQRAFKTA